eukprot:Phypoly_transcript_04414.p1 GENE.Phypoly_transcript_04414~~Phypoly_transcript_04414.p1  ORF type:complete len:453 (+),score=60.73 Phypoly_transcript_04414:408-1766(+)
MSVVSVPTLYKCPLLSRINMILAIDAISSSAEQYRVVNLNCIDPFGFPLRVVLWREQYDRFESITPAIKSCFSKNKRPFIRIWNGMVRLVKDHRYDFYNPVEVHVSDNGDEKRRVNEYRIKCPGSNNYSHLSQNWNGLVSLPYEIPSSFKNKNFSLGKGGFKVAVSETSPNLNTPTSRKLIFTPAGDDKEKKEKRKHESEEEENESQKVAKSDTGLHASGVKQEKQQEVETKLEQICNQEHLDKSTYDKLAYLINDCAKFLKEHFDYELSKMKANFLESFKSVHNAMVFMKEKFEASEKETKNLAHAWKENFGDLLDQLERIQNVLKELMELEIQSRKKILEDAKKSHKSILNENGSDIIDLRGSNTPEKKDTEMVKPDSRSDIIPEKKDNAMAKPDSGKKLLQLQKSTTVKKGPLDDEEITTEEAYDSDKYNEEEAKYEAEKKKRTVQPRN